MILSTYREHFRQYLFAAGWTETAPINTGFKGMTVTLWEEPGYRKGQLRWTYDVAICIQVKQDFKDRD